MTVLADASVLQPPPGSGGSRSIPSAGVQPVPVGPGLTPEEVEEWQQVGRLARQWGLKTVDLAVRVVPDEVRALVPRELAESDHLCPITGLQVPALKSPRKRAAINGGRCDSVRLSWAGQQR